MEEFISIIDKNDMNSDIQEHFEAVILEKGIRFEKDI